MRDAEFYRNRGQTYLKHFFLERYLERVLYVTGSAWPDFVFVDGFSGPWRSIDEKYEDTSFVIAINKIRQVREGLLRAGRAPRIRCLFIEKDQQAYRELSDHVQDIDDIEITVKCGEFENLVDEIVRYIGRSFSLVFIDPTGWTGFGLDTIRPILQLRGEVIVNFMYDFISRHIENPQPQIISTFEPLFGGAGWDSEVINFVQEGRSREAAIIKVYLERMRTTGKFRHVTSTRILKPLADRAYFHLVYGTNHWRGLDEFRAVEKAAVGEQDRVRDIAQFHYEFDRTQQGGLFGPGELPRPAYSFEGLRADACGKALERLSVLVSERKDLRYEDILADLLEEPLVWRSDVNSWLGEMRTAGTIEIVGMGARERVPKEGYLVRLLDVN